MDSQAPFFRPGGTLEPGAESYIARDADAQLLAALMAGEYVFLLDSRQKGKSSLVARTIVKLKEQGVRTVKLDLQRIGANVTPEQWYAGLLSGIGQELGVSKELFAYWEDRQSLGPLARWLGAIESVMLKLLTGPIVVFIDEVDFVRTLPFSTDEFFAGIRDCYNRRSGDPAFRRLTFCLVGVATPGQLIRNPEITPFNIGTRINLSDFTLLEMKAYEKALDGADRVGMKLLERVHYWLNGHPYLTQLLCSHLVANPTVNSSQGVDRLVRDLFFTPEARHREPNFADVERRILDPDVPGLSPDEKRTQVLELYGRVLKGKKVEAAEENPVVASLQLAGIGNEERGILSIRNLTYAMVFDEAWRRQSLPDAEARRQKRAATRAGFRVGSVAVVLLIVAGVVGVGYRRLAKTAELERDRAQSEAYQAAMTSCTQFEQDHFWPGILATVESLRDNPERGWEWDYWHHFAQSRILSGDDGTTMDWRWARDGRSVIGRSPHSIRWFEPTTGRLKREIPVAYTGLASTRELPGDQLIDIRWDGTICVLNAGTGHELWRVSGLLYYWRATSTLSAGGRFLAGGHESDGLWVLDIATRGVVRPKPPVGGVYFRPSFGGSDDLMAAIVGYKGRVGKHDIALISTQTWQLKDVLTVGTGLQSIVLSPSGSDLAFGDDQGRLRIHSIADRRDVYDQRVSDRPIWRMEISPNGQYLAAGLLNGSVIILRKQGKRWVEMGKIQGAQDSTFSPDSVRVLSSDFRGRVQNLTELDSEGIKIPGNRWHLLPDRNELVAFGEEGEGRVYGLTSKGITEKRRLKGPATGEIWGRMEYFSGQAEGATIISSINDGTEVARLPPFSGATVAVVGSSQELLVLYVRRSELLVLDRITSRKSTLELGFIANGIFGSCDGSRFIITGANGELGLFEVASRNLKVVRFSHHSVHHGAFSPDGAQFVVAFSDGALRIVDWKSGRLVQLFERHPGMAIAAIFSPDGRRIVSCGDDNTVRIWNTKTGRLLTVLRGHSTTVRQVEFIDSGATLVSIDSAGECLFWRTR